MPQQLGIYKITSPTGKISHLYRTIKTKRFITGWLLIDKKQIV